MASKWCLMLLGALAAHPAVDAASVTTPRRQAADSSPGFVSFPVQRNDRSSRTLSGRQATASLINEQETSYTIELTFGSNAQPVKVAIDTGSDELFVDPNCNDADFTRAQVQQCKEQGAYNPSTSSSSKATGATSQIVYGSGSVDLAYYIDTIGIPGADRNLTAVQFGKATASQDLSEGILGLGYGDGVNLNYSNFVDALQAQGVTNTKAFSVALGTSATAGGAVIFGGVDTKKYSGALAQLPIAAPARRDIQRYAVAMTSLTYLNSSGSHKYDSAALSNVVLDTGSSLCELPAALVAALAADLGASEDSSSGLLVMDDCDDVTGASDKRLEFGFAGVTVAVPLRDFVLQDGSTCVLGVMALPANSGITALLGDTFLRSAYVVFDQTNARIGMAQYADCGTHEQAIPAGSAGASGFTGECSASDDAANSSSSSPSSSGGGDGKSAAAVGGKPPAGSVFALVAGLVALMGMI